MQKTEQIDYTRLQPNEALTLVLSQTPLSGTVTFFQEHTVIELDFKYGETIDNSYTDCQCEYDGQRTFTVTNLLSSMGQYKIVVDYVIPAYGFNSDKSVVEVYPSEVTCDAQGYAHSIELIRLDASGADSFLVDANSTRRGYIGVFAQRPLEDLEIIGFRVITVDGGRLVGFTKNLNNNGLLVYVEVTNTTSSPMHIGCSVRVEIVYIRKGQQDSKADSVKCIFNGDKSKTKAYSALATCTKQQAIDAISIYQLKKTESRTVSSGESTQTFQFTTNGFVIGVCALRAASDNVAINGWSISQSSGVCYVTVYLFNRGEELTTNVKCGIAISDYIVPPYGVDSTIYGLNDSKGKVPVVPASLMVTKDDLYNAISFPYLRASAAAAVSSKSRGAITFDVLKYPSSEPYTLPVSAIAAYGGGSLYCEGFEIVAGETKTTMTLDIYNPTDSVSVWAANGGGQGIEIDL